MFKHALLLLSALSIATTGQLFDQTGAIAQESANIEVGKAAPPLSFSRVLQAPTDVADLAKLRGKVVVLEFWATWCPPCVDNIPHLNQLSAKLPKDKVQFIAVNRELAEVQARFLERQPMNAWIGIDDGQTTKRYQARRIPEMVIIDKQGLIVSISHPAAVQVENIENILAGHPSGIRQIVVRNPL
jgi:thiol-disulfide isomerase/thioredoxin